MTQHCACPVLEALANEGFIDPAGITDEQFVRAARRLGLATDMDGIPLKLLADIRAAHGVASFDAINKHNGIAGECDGSLFKSDYHMGDHTIVSEGRVAALRALSTDGATVTRGELVSHWLNMLDSSVETNARFGLSGNQVSFVTVQNLSTLFALLQRDDGRVPLSSIDELMLYKRIPPHNRLTKLAVLVHFPYVLARLATHVAMNPPLALALSRTWLAPVYDTLAFARNTWIHAR
jgi:hypothetical protein